jgi:hypothetical protein
LMFVLIGTSPILADSAPLGGMPDPFAVFGVFAD